MSTTEARQDLDRIRRARAGNDGPTDGPEILVCPIDGCNRTIINDVAGLRSHVRESVDDDHRFKILNEDLQVEIDETAYHSAWEPGGRDEYDDSGIRSAYDPEDVWRPGVPVIEP